MEEIIGKLSNDPYIKYTQSGKLVGAAIIETTEETIHIVVWEDLNEVLNDYIKGSQIKIKGYRKFNTFIQKEQFVVQEFLDGD